MGLCRDCMVYPKFRSRRLESRSQKLLFSYSRRYDRSPFWRIGRIRHPLSVNSGICPLTHLSRFMRGIPCDSWGKPSRCAVLMRRNSDFMRHNSDFMRRSSEFMRHSSEFMRHSSVLKAQRYTDAGVRLADTPLYWWESVAALRWFAGLLRTKNGCLHMETAVVKRLSNS